MKRSPIARKTPLRSRRPTARQGITQHIPDEARQAVYLRDGYACVVCGNPGTDWHHRRSRSVRDSHTHCTCNGVTVCWLHHDEIHANPQHSRMVGWIVSRWATPSVIPMEARDGTWLLTCDGSKIATE